MGHARLLPHRLLGLEHQRLGLQIRGVGLCGRRPCRNWLRHVRFGIQSRPRAAAGEDDGEFPAAQRLPDRTRDSVPLVRLAGLQRRVILRRELAGCASVLEHQFDSDVRGRDLDDSRLEAREEMVHGRLVLRRHLRPRSCHARVRFLHILGLYRSRCSRRQRVQLQHQKYLPPCSFLPPSISSLVPSASLTNLPSPQSNSGST